MYLCPAPSPACFSDYLPDTGESPWRHYPCASQLQGTPFYCHNRRVQDNYRVTSERVCIPLVMVNGGSLVHSWGAV